MELTRHTITCKGTLRRTRKICGMYLCDSDGENIIIPLAGGKDLVITPKRGTNIFCSECGYRTVIGTNGKVKLAVKV